MKKFVRVFLLALVTCHMLPVTCHAVAEIRDTEIESVLYELVEPLARAAGIPDGRLRIHILNEDDFNAFVSRGEDIYIYTGLIARVSSPGAFQAVVAHELGHMAGGHMAQMSARMDAELKRSLIVQALGIALMAANPMAGAGVLAGAGGIATQSMLAFSRDEERVADDMGIELMVRACLDPDGFIEVMKQMNEMTGVIESRINPNNINHPMTEERLKNLKEKIKELEKRKPKNCPAANEKQMKERYATIRAKVVGYLAPMDRVGNLYPAKDTSAPAIYARSIASMRAGGLADAKTGALTLIARDGKNPYYYELLGDIEYQSGHYDDSATAYEKALELAAAGDDATSANMSQIQTAYALVLVERKKPGDADRAVEMAKRALLRDAAPMAYMVLARAEGLRGNAGISDWAMAEYYAGIKQTKKSREFAKRAQKQLPKNSPEYIKSGDLLK